MVERFFHPTRSNGAMDTKSKDLICMYLVPKMLELNLNSRKAVKKQIFKFLHPNTYNQNKAWRYNLTIEIMDKATSLVNSQFPDYDD